MGSIRQRYATDLAQLTSFFTKKSARIGWNILKPLYTKVTDGLTPIIKKVLPVNKKYSLRVVDLLIKKIAQN